MVSFVDLLVVVLQSLSHVQLFMTPWTTARRLLCPSVSPGAGSNSCPSSRWYHPTISSSVALFSFCLQSFPASGSFQMNRLFTSSAQSIGASATVLPMNIQNWFPLGLTGLISLLSRWLSKESSPAPRFKTINCVVLSLLYGPALTSIRNYWKTITLTIWTFVSKVMPLLFNMLSRLS